VRDSGGEEWGRRACRWVVGGREEAIVAVFRKPQSSYSRHELSPIRTAVCPCLRSFRAVKARQDGSGRRFLCSGSTAERLGEAFFVLREHAERLGELLFCAFTWVGHPLGGAFLWLVGAGRPRWTILLALTRPAV